eukprot:3132147-Pyramimonas_sp.AAC.1
MKRGFAQQEEGKSQADNATSTKQAAWKYKIANAASTIKASGLCTCPDRSCPTWHHREPGTYRLQAQGEEVVAADEVPEIIGRP